jgi:hypothetical protein
MSKKYAVYVTSCAAIIVFALAVALPAFVDIPVLWYRPVDRTWSFDVHASGIAMDFFGRCLFATAASGIGAAISYAIARRVCRHDPARATTAVLCVWAIAITLIVIAFVSWRQAHRTLVSTPLFDRDEAR